MTEFVEGDVGFAFVERIFVESGRPRPVLPEGVVAWYVASPHEECPWGLYGFRVADAELFRETSLLLELASEELTSLLDSAREFPPALALARDVVDLNFDDVPEKEEFTRLFCDELRHFLGDLNAPVFMAEAQIDQDDLRRGCFYWIVGYEAVEKKMLGVGRDGWLEQFNPTVFGLTHEFLRWRFR